MAAYKVKSPLNHDGTSYAVDERIELDQAFATSLLESGVIEAIADADVAAGEDVTPAKKPGRK